MKPIEIRKHHYVPQFLLRNFAIENRDTLHAFDKWTNRCFPVSIGDAAAERGYNAFSTDGLSGCAEDFCTRIEEVIQEVVSSRRLPTMTHTTRAALVQFAVAQMLRSKNYRAVSSHIGDLLRTQAEQGITLTPEEARQILADRRSARGR